MTGTDHGRGPSASRRQGFAESVTLLLIIAILSIGLIVAWPTVKDAVISELVDTGAAVDEINQSYSYSGMQGSYVAGSAYQDGIDAGQTADPAGDFGRGVSLVAAGPEELPTTTTTSTTTTSTTTTSTTTTSTTTTSTTTTSTTTTTMPPAPMGCAPSTNPTCQTGVAGVM